MLPLRSEAEREAFIAADFGAAEFEVADLVDGCGGNADMPRSSGNRAPAAEEVVFAARLVVGAVCCLFDKRSVGQICRYRRYRGCQGYGSKGCGGNEFA